MKILIKVFKHDKQNFTHGEAKHKTLLSFIAMLWRSRQQTRSLRSATKTILNVYGNERRTANERQIQLL